MSLEDAEAPKLIWEFDFEDDEEVAVFVWRLVEWHAKTLATHHLIWLHDFALIILDSYLPTVKMCDCHINAGKGIEQRDLLLDEQVSSLSLE